VSNPAPPPRVHLVERALEAMSGHDMGLAIADARPPAGVEIRPPAAIPPPLHGAAVVVTNPPPPVISLEQLRGAGLMVVGQEPRRSRLAEEFALVHQQMLRVMHAAGNTPARNVVMITSAHRGEGRSFVALNLAASIASSSGRTVVLVDADGGPTSLTRALGLYRAPASVATQRPHDALVSTAIARLSVLPRGEDADAQHRQPRGAELVLTLRALIAACPNHVLVLDAPAALASSDAHALASAVGHVIMVVRAEVTPRDAVEAALDVVESCPSLQLLLNRTNLNSSDSMAAHGESGARAHA